MNCAKNVSKRIIYQKINKIEIETKTRKIKPKSGIQFPTTAGRTNGCNEFVANGHSHLLTAAAQKTQITVVCKFITLFANFHNFPDFHMRAEKMLGQIAKTILDISIEVVMNVFTQFFIFFTVTFHIIFVYFARTAAY